MRFVLENINKVRRADILLNGLTVVTGENDSGKSAVGKLLFSTVKTLVNADMPVSTQKQSLLDKYISSLYNPLSGRMVRRPSDEVERLVHTQQLPRPSVDALALHSGKACVCFVEIGQRYIMSPLLYKQNYFGFPQDTEKYARKLMADIRTDLSVKLHKPAPPYSDRHIGNNHTVAQYL